MKKKGIEDLSLWGRLAILSAIVLFSIVVIVIAIQQNKNSSEPSAPTAPGPIGVKTTDGHIEA